MAAGIWSFLFTDVEGSSRLWEAYPAEMDPALALHDRIIEDAVSSAGGELVKGTGDGFMAVFTDPVGAIDAAVAAQRALGSADFAAVGNLTVRMGVHTGEAQPRAGDYYGPAVNRAARLMGIGHGGQVLVSSSTARAIGAALPEPARLRSLGEHRLKDLTAPEQVYQLDHPELRREFPPLDSLDAFANNLPSMVDSFVGREDDLAHILDTIGRSRLVTLTGPGGTGKTRLAIEAAARSIGEFPWGAWLVDLAPISNPAVVPSEIAESIGIEPQPGRDVVDTLIRRLEDRGMLVVLDNCDHLVEACADTSQRLLKACPTLKILATSRQRLGVAGEHVVVVDPLSYPQATGGDVDDLLAYEAVQLFADRATQADSGWSLDPSTLPGVARIAASVEGLPLAIELAAARTRVLTVGQIADRLDQQLAVLGAPGAGDGRHGALRATIDWSYETMNADEQRLFDTLSVFRGGADFAAIEAVCTSGLGSSLLDALDGLVSKSMIIADQTAHGMRYRVLEPLRQYGAERLDEHGDPGAAYTAHWRYFDELAVEVERGVRSSDQLDWLAKTESDYDNLRAALARAYDAGDLTTCISLAGSLSWFMFLHSKIEDWDLWLPRLLDRGEDADPTKLVRLLLGASQHAWELSRMDEAEVHGARALELAESIGSDTLAAWAHTYLALLRALAIDPDPMEPHLATADTVFQAKGNVAGVGSVVWLRAFATLIATDLGTLASRPDLDALTKHMNAVVAGARQGGDRNLLGHTLWTSAWAARLKGDYETAHRESAEGTQALYELGNQYCLAHNLLFAGYIAHEEGDPGRAVTLLSASDSIKDRLGVTGTPLDIEYARRLRESTSARLDAPVFAAAWEEGQRLAIATAVGLATI